MRWLPRLALALLFAARSSLAAEVVAVGPIGFTGSNLVRMVALKRK